MITSKSTVSADNLYAYTSSFQDSPVHIVWANLNGNDSDPQHFWKTFLSALSAWDVLFTQRERQNPFPASQEEREGFFQRFASGLKDNPLIVTFVDLQLITGSKVPDFLHALRKMQIPELYIILVRNEGRISDVTQVMDPNSLSEKCRYLSPEEEVAYYNSCSLLLSPNEFDRIRSFTDGWKPAVDVIARLITLEGKDTVLTDFREYLYQWIQLQYFQYCSTLERELTACLSLLDRFPLELVQHLYQWTNESLLEYLAGSPFLRFHQETLCFYFARFLDPLAQRSQLMLSTKRKEEFFIQVGNWYQERGQKTEAVSCYRKAKAYPRILKLMQQWTFPNTRKTAACYLEAINDMPASFLEKHPLIHIVRAYMLHTLYRFQDSELLLSRFCKERDLGDQTPADLRPVLGEAYVLHAHTRASRLALDAETIQMYQRGAELLPNGSAMIRRKVNQLADCSAIDIPDPAAGSMENYLDRLRQVEPHVTHITNGGWAGVTHLARAELNYYIRNFKEVESHALKAVHTALSHKQYDIVCSAYFLLMKFNLAKGNYHRTMENFNLLKHHAMEAEYDTFFSMPDLAEAWLNLKMGNIYEVAGWLRDEEAYQQRVMPWNYGRDRVIRCLYLLETHQYGEVKAYADSSYDMLRKRSYHLLCLQLMTMKAIALLHTGEEDKAVAITGEIYHWSHGNNLVMPVVEHGNQAKLLMDCCKRDPSCAIPAEWLEEMGRKANSYYVYLHNVRKQHGRIRQVQQSVLEKLTGAEQRLLLMLCRGMLLTEIAAQQGKSIGAVKAMAHRLYVKIGAEDKADAVHIALECRIEELVSL